VSAAVQGVRRLAVTAGLLACFAAEATAQDLTQAEADSMRAKVAFIIETGDSLRGPAMPAVHTSFTDREVNAYSKFYGPTFLPPGITDPRVAIDAHGRVTARGIFDLDAVRRARKRDWLDPLAYVAGAVEVTAAGFISGSDGLGVLRFESATLAGVSIPKGVLQELVRYYTATAQRPNGFGLDEPFTLPAKIRSVVLDHGHATIVQ